MLKIYLTKSSFSPTFTEKRKENYSNAIYLPFGLNVVQTVRREEWALQENSLLETENVRVAIAAMLTETAETATAAAAVSGWQPLTQEPWTKVNRVSFGGNVKLCLALILWKKIEGVTGLALFISPPYLNLKLVSIVAFLWMFICLFRTVKQAQIRFDWLIQIQLHAQELTSVFRVVYSVHVQLTLTWWVCKKLYHCFL